MEPADYVLSNDAHWYAGVLEGCERAARRGATVFISGAHYTNVEGTYKYPDGEGKFEIICDNKGNATVKNSPRGNQTYEH